MTDPTPQTTPTRDEAVRSYPNWPEYLMIRDTGLHDDQGGLGQRIYTTAGAGYKKVRYIREDLASAPAPAICNVVPPPETYGGSPETPWTGKMPPASGRVDAVAGLSRADICRLWQWAAVNKPSSMTVEGFTDLLLNEIDGRSDPAKVQSITAQYLECLYFADNCLSSNGLFAQAKQLRDRIASLSPAATPVSEAGDDLKPGTTVRIPVSVGYASPEASFALAKPASSPAGGVREAAAELVEQMLEQEPYAKWPQARMSLTIAARAIRRGRHLTEAEKAANLMSAIFDEGES